MCKEGRKETNLCHLQSHLRSTWNLCRICGPTSTKVCDFLVDVSSSGREAPIEPQEVEIDYQQDDSVRYMLGELSEAAAKE